MSEPTCRSFSLNGIDSITPTRRFFAISDESSCKMGAGVCIKRTAGWTTSRTVLAGANASIAAGLTRRSFPAGQAETASFLVSNASYIERDSLQGFNVPQLTTSLILEA